MRKNILDIFQLLVELKNEKSVPEKYEKELDRCINHLKEIIEKDGFDTLKINWSLIVQIIAVLEAYFRSP